MHDVNEMMPGAQVLASTIFLAAPGPVGEMATGRELNVPETAVRLYDWRTTPAKVQLEILATPAAAVKLVQDPKVPPETVKEIEAVDEVTILPATSSTETTGWTVKGDSEAPATGGVVKTNLLAAPGPVGVKLVLGSDVNVPDDVVI